MTTTIQFYHLLSTGPERAVPKLMEKALANDARVLMLFDNEASLKSMSDALWSHNPNGFLPHGSAREPHAEQQPILLALTDANLNNATILCIMDGSSPASLSQFSKVLDVFDGNDEAAVAHARSRWVAYKEAGHRLQYVQQQPSGSWKIEAEANAQAA
jgi:DNA polymerase-3 subunit chi